MASEEKSGKVIEKKRRTKGYTQEQLSNLSGYRSWSTLSQWEKGKRPPPLEFARKVAVNLGLDAEWVVAMVRQETAQYKVERDEYIRQRRADITLRNAMQRPAPMTNSDKDSEQYNKPTGVVRIPVLARIPAGDLFEVTEDLELLVEEFEYLSADMVSDLRRVFALTVTGDSMTHRKVEPGDRIVIDAGQEPDDGDLAVIRVSETEGLLREVHYQDSMAILHSGSGPPQLRNRDEIVFVGKVIKIIKTP